MEALEELMNGVGIQLPVGRERELWSRFSKLLPPLPLAVSSPEVARVIEGTAFVRLPWYPKAVSDAWEEVSCDLGEEQCQTWKRRFFLQFDGLLRVTQEHPERVLEAVVELFRSILHPLRYPQDLGLGGFVVIDGDLPPFDSPGEALEAFAESRGLLLDPRSYSRLCCCIWDSSLGDHRVFAHAARECLMAFGLPLLPFDRRGRADVSTLAKAFLSLF